MTEDAAFRVSGCPLENTDQGWGERGLAAEQPGSESLLTAQFSCVGNQAAGLIQKPLEAFVVIALVEMLLRSGTHKLKGMLGTPAAG